MNQDFMNSINKKLLVQVVVNSKEKGMITRKCIPFDYGPSKRYHDGLDRYHFYDLDSPDGKHNLSILPSQLVSLSLLSEQFDPAKFITWTPNWIVPRDWGRYS